MRGNWLVSLVMLAFAAIAGCIGVTRATCYDLESAANNEIQAWSASDWIQTSRVDFEAGVIFQVDTATFPGDVILENTGSEYRDSGSLASQVLDSTVDGEVWNALTWDASLEFGTGISFEVRASDDAFGSDNGTLAWSYAGDMSPVMSGLPAGRYMQWRAILTTSDNTVTPALYEVRVYHY